MSLRADEMEQRAERAVRRGELLAAIELFEAVLAQRPDDERVRQRMESVRALLQPSELVHRRKAEPEHIEPEAIRPLSHAEQGELHAASGRFVEARVAYERALEDNPGNELIRERLEELQKLAPPHSLAVDDGLAAAPRLEGLAASRGTPRADPALPARSARAADSAFRPIELTPPAGRTPPRASPAPQPPAPTRGASASAPLPSDPVEMLQALLERVRGGRRSNHAGA